MSLTRDDVVAYLHGLDAHALGELVDELQRRLGLPPPVRPGRIAMGPPMVMGVPLRSDDYTVVLTDYDANRKIHLLKELRATRPLALYEAVALLDQLPVVILAEVTRPEADALAARLREVGGRVEIRTNPASPASAP